MPYGTIKIDTITFTDAGVDKSVSVSGLVENPTFTGNVTATGTISGAIVQAVTVTGTTANFVSGVYTTQISGAIVKVPAGGAGAPSIQVGVGTSVAPGLYGAGTDLLGISTGGAGRVFVDSTGRLGIGTSTPGAPLSVIGAVIGESFGINATSLASVIANGVFAPTGNTLGFTTNSTERMRIDSSGRLLVGASASITAVTFPSLVQSNSFYSYQSSLFSADANGSNTFFLKSRNATTGSHTVVQVNDLLGAINFAGSDGTNFVSGATIAAVVDGTPGTNDMPGRLVFSTTADGATSPTEKMRIDNAGNITWNGVGLKLTTGRNISATVDNSSINILGGDITTNPGANIELYGGTHVSFANAMILDANEHRFRTASGTTERMRIDSSGNVGIGGAPGAYRLDVLGSGGQRILNQGGGSFLEIGQGTTTNQSAYIDLVTDTTYADYGLRVIRDGAGAPNSTSQLVHRGTSDLRITTQDAAPITFYTTNAERARIDSSGRLLVGTSSAITYTGGTTPSITVAGTSTSASRYGCAIFSNDANGSGLHIAKSRGATVGTQGVLSADDLIGFLTFDGSDGANFQRAALISANVDGTPGTNDMPGRLVFSTTADGAASPTERMRISSNGAVSIPTGSLSLGPSGGEGGQLEIRNTTNTGTVYFLDASNDTLARLFTVSNNTDLQIGQVAGTGGNVGFYTGGSERARIDSPGRLLVGTSSARTSFFGGTVTPVVQLEQSSLATVLSVVRNSADNGDPLITLCKTRGTANGSNTIVAADDFLGGITFQGADGVNLFNAATIRVNVDGTPGVGDMPGRLVFSTTADGASSATEQLRISNGGTVIYNQPAPAAVDVTATLTVANLTAKIITSSTAAAVTMTLPTGTLMDGGFSGLYNNMAFEWSVINTGATNAVTVQNGASHTIVGSGTVAASNSGRFLSRRTGATTWVTYRLSS
jgi:hypothetical protein